MRMYKQLIYAGTFDHLHIGHKYMLKRAFELAKRVAIGITSDEMVKSKTFSVSIEKMEDRRWMVEKYLKENNFFKKAKIFILHDIYGPAIEDNSYDAILVTEATRGNAVKVNKVRKLKGLKSLKLVVEPMAMADDGKPVTSKRIRAGEIDSNGRNYKLQMTNDKLKKQLLLPQNLREELRKPLGKIIKSQETDHKIQTNLKSQIPHEKNLKENARKIIQSINPSTTLRPGRSDLFPPMVIAVGDIVTMSLMQVGLDPDVKIIDLRSRRKKISSIQNFFESEYENFESYPVTNQSGTINLQAIKAIQKSFSNFLTTGKKELIVVDGEEDLLALPAILFAPLGSLVVYGQWNLGAIVVNVTEEKKKEIERIIEKFI